MWVVGSAALVAALLYWEQTALLYVLSTLAMCGLLLVVAFSDLEGRDKELTAAAPREETAPAGGAELTVGAAPGRSAAWRGKGPARRVKRTARRDDGFD